MQSATKEIFILLSVGASIAIGKMLESQEHITPGLFLGRTILGSALSLSASAILIKYPEASPFAICGMGSVLGIVGHQVVELWLRKKFKAENKTE